MASAMRQQSTEPALPPVLWALLFGNFVIGTGVMVVPGTMNQISASLDVSVPVAGQLVTAGAIVMCLGAPVLASLVGGWERRRLLTASMLWFGLLHVVSAAMPDFASLMLARILTVVSPAIFTPQAAACVGLLVAPAQRGKAITLVFLGWSVASVLGMPAAAWIGGAFGWRSAFMLVGLMGLVSAIWVWRAMPDAIRPPAMSRATWRATLGSPALTLCIGVTVLYSAGQFVLFSYFAPYYKWSFGITPLQLSLMFAWFGAFGFIGNLWVSRYIDHFGAARTVMLAVASMALSLAIWPMGTSLVLAAVVSVPWALGCFASNSAQQARLVGIAPHLASGSIALNTSAMYAGQAVGAASGGWLIAAGQLSNLHWAGLAGLVAAMLLSGSATRAAKAHPALS